VTAEAFAAAALKKRQNSSERTVNLVPILNGLTFAQQAFVGFGRDGALLNNF
jgi:hypothetical protein